MFMHIYNAVHVELSALSADMNSSDGQRSATTCLLLPGKVLDLKALSQKRTFRNCGNKAGAVRGFEILEENGLGNVIATKINRGATMVIYSKVYVHI